LPKRIGEFTDDIEEWADKPIRNPMDEINNHRREAAERAHAIRRMKYCALGIVIGLAGQFLIVSLMPAPDGNEQGSIWDFYFPKSKTEATEGANERFQGKPVVVAAGGQKLLAHDEKSGEDLEVVPTGTSTIPHFPKTIYLPSATQGNEEESEYTLLGLGIRTVSFLSIQVYVVGLYVQTSSLATLQTNLIRHINPIASALIPGEREQLKHALLDADKSYEIWDTLLTEKGSNVKMAVRVVPTRNTDFGHLKDGWVRGITSRMQAASAKGDKSFSDDSFGAALKEFKTILSGKGKAPTGSVILLTRDGNGSMGVLYQEKDGKVSDFGTIEDERIARLVWLGYLGGKNVSSEPARLGVVDGIMELVGRPIGSVETKVS
jgi:hypothetical protein